LNEEARKGDLPVAEFLPFTDINKLDVGPGLKDFFQAVTVMKELKPEWDITYVINTVPLESVLAYCGMNPRKYALVKINFSKSEAYIIEFDLSDGHSISTILFCPGYMDFVDALFGEYIIGQGNWAREELKDIKTIKIDWAKHTSIDSNLWGQRLIDKIVKIL
jgi:hypothetical protein